MADQNARKMIRFDDDDGDEQVVESTSEQPVMPHSCEEYLVRDHQGISYQKCGGGRRRLQKRSH